MPRRKEVVRGRQGAERALEPDKRVYGARNDGGLRQCGERVGARGGERGRVDVSERLARNVSKCGPDNAHERISGESRVAHKGRNGRLQ